MNPGIIKDWIELIALVVVWIVSGAILWSRQNSKINGLGRRVKKIEESCSGTEVRMDTFEKELNEYRRDVLDVTGRLSRVEKGVEEVGDEVRQGNIVLGAQLHTIEKLIGENNLKTEKKLVRIETLQRIEQKIGPIPED